MVEEVVASSLFFRAQKEDTEEGPLGMLAQMHHGSVTIVSLSLHEDHDLGTRCHDFCATQNRGDDLYISISSKMRHRRKMSRAYLRRLSNAVVGMSPGLSLAKSYEPHRLVTTPS